MLAVHTIVPLHRFGRESFVVVVDPFLFQVIRPSRVHRGGEVVCSAQLLLDESHPFRTSHVRLQSDAAFRADSQSLLLS